ncbi:MAG: hypothetical protein HY762_00725 [Planctomycetes bacterium]|nr:hypothetical protein [Planctomycetota bacterium]
MDKELPHSGQGITGTVLGALGIFLFFAAIAAAFLYHSYEADTEDIFSWIVYILVPDALIALAGFGISLKGLLNRERKKLFAVIGCLLNGLLIITLATIFMWYFNRKP